MRKKIPIVLLILLVLFALTINQLRTIKREEISPDPTQRIIRIYPSWDEAKLVGEYIYDEQVGMLKFERAVRIENSEKFKVTYVSDTIHKQ
ncbi:MAG: hypothetical protein K0R34_1614 [Herbinix sp.]|jgi:hypothetical protein|nr:hypothetical protein [Herbinix sp.]